MLLCIRRVLVTNHHPFLHRPLSHHEQGCGSCSYKRLHRFWRKFQGNATILGEREDLFSDSKVRRIELLSNDNARGASEASQPEPLKVRSSYQLMTFPAESICFIFSTRRVRVSSFLAAEYQTMNSFLWVNDKLSNF